MMRKQIGERRSGQDMALKRSLGKKFLLSVGSVVTLTILLFFVFIFRQSERAIMDQVDHQSRTLLQQVMLTRAWIADQGGIYVKRGPGVKENPYLPGTTVVDAKGDDYVFHTPEYVTRILSGYAEQQGLYRFHITSLKPINPINAPTPFEEKTLKEFERKTFEKSRDGVAAVISEQGKRFYQRTIPLRVERSCLHCHGKQGYREGEIRGGLSVMIPMALTEAALMHNWIVLSVGCYAILAAVGISLYLVLRKVVLAPVDHLHQVASQLLGGDYSAQADLKTGDELEELAKAYNAMTKHIIDSFEAMVKTLASAIAARDPYTAGHVERVSAFVKVIADEMEIEPKLKHQIVMGAILHDIGKIGISDDILRKPGALNAAESATMRSHVNKGAEIVASTADFSSLVQSAILSHHEHFDGTGYPRSLKGEKIPIGDRIIAVADTFDAMITDRPYRNGMPREAAIAQLKKLAGTQLDPKVVEAFLRAYEQGRLSGQNVRRNAHDGKNP
jgi:HD-GYP domain-containing protein (c-di-GMP phosphodiesterase class II)